MIKLSEAHLSILRSLEADLKKAIDQSNPDLANNIANKIADFLNFTPNHHRSIRAKLISIESFIDKNRIQEAEKELSRIYYSIDPKTRLSLEANLLYTIIQLRKKDIESAKTKLRNVISSINNIKSEKTRQDFQSNLISRIEEECVLAEISGTGSLDPIDIQKKQSCCLNKKKTLIFLDSSGNPFKNQTQNY